MNKVDRVDAGLSLIELIIVVVLLGILGSTVALIFVNSWRAQSSVTSTTDATNRGQLIGQNIERAVRNAQAISTTDSLLMVHTTLAGSRACEAFWITGGALYMTTTNGVLPAATTPPVGWPNPWEPEGVANDGSIPFFVQNGATVSYDFMLGTDAAPVHISGDASMRFPATGVTAPCW